MKNSRVRIASFVLALCTCTSVCGCKPKQDEHDIKDNITSKNEMTTQISKKDIMDNTTFSPTVYEVDEIKKATETAAGSFEAWAAQVIKDRKSNDDRSENSVIHSPFHSLTVNGVNIPVYTARCAESAHSFAWIDVTSAGEEFLLDAELTLSKNFSKCVILPESKGVSADIDQKTVKTELSAVGSYTFTFSEDKNAKYTDPTFAPLTVMVTRNAESEIPKSYNKVYIEPGYHENDELEFTKGNTVYVIKKGYHNVCSIGMPSNSVLLIEQGAYIQATDRKQPDGSYNTKTVLHADHCNNVKIISRGLIDCGKLQGGEVKYKHVVNTAVSRNVTIQGLTIINSNTWTLCAYGAYNDEIKENLLLGYRTYSDGIMMSDCTKSTGSYNFVRTGDDAIEFKGTGWWNGEARVGKDCVYEYNDLWTDKGAGYCLTWESACDMKGMIFRNNSVGFALPTWTSRNTALDCLLGTDADTKWSDVTFENIEIYHVKSPNAINLQIQGNGATLENITFKNITVKTSGNGVYALRMHFSAEGGKISDIKLQNVNFCGTRLTQAQKKNTVLFKNEAGKYFDELEIS